MAKTPAKPPANPKSQTAKSAAVVEETVVEGSSAPAKPEGGAGQLRLKDLVDTVMQATGAKAKDAREIVQATLAELGAALERGDALNLPEFGKGRVTRKATDTDGSTAMVLKLRRGGAGPKKKEDKEALAAADE